MIIGRKGEKLVEKEHLIEIFIFSNKQAGNRRDKTDVVNFIN